MRLLYPDILWLLSLLPILMLLKGKRGAAPALLFSSTSIVRVLAEGKKIRAGSIVPALKLGAMALLIIALARPQLGNTTTEINASGIDILLAVDISSSMKAMDFTLAGKSVNRLDVVKNVLAGFIEARPNDRIGLIAFAAKPYLVSPLTLDHDWLYKRLQSLSIVNVEDDGTAIGSAIGSGANRLRDRESRSQIIILLTDGVNNSGRVPPLIAAEAAETLSIKVYTIGAGTRGLAPYPVMEHGRPRLVRAKVDIDEDTLRKIAEKTGGLYFRATDSRSLAQIYEEINAMETTTRSITKFENYRELFPYCLAAVFMLLLMSFFMHRSRLP